MFYFTSDIGGTNARFALFEKKENRFVLLYTKWLMSQEYDSFLLLYKKLCEEDANFAAENIEECVIALAGLVEDKHTAKLTNLSWGIDLKQIKKQMPNFPKATLVNDFSAQAMAFSKIEDVDYFNELKLESFFASKKVNFPLLVTGAGTGFGCAYLSKIKDNTLYSKENFFLQASEAGHQNFAFDTQNKEEMELADFIARQKNNSKLKVEDLLSGKGLEYIHEFLTQEKIKAKEIPLSSPAFHLFSIFYARVLKDLCLNSLAKSAIITGGIVAKHEHILNKNFYEEFIKHETMSNALQEVNFFLNKNEDIALLGAAFFMDCHVASSSQ